MKIDPNWNFIGALAFQYSLNTTVAKKLKSKFQADKYLLQFIIHIGIFETMQGIQFIDCDFEECE
jgi:hypothetical protein